MPGSPRCWWTAWRRLVPRTFSFPFPITFRPAAVDDIVTLLLLAFPWRARRLAGWVWITRLLWITWMVFRGYPWILLLIWIRVTMPVLICIVNEDHVIQIFFLVAA